MNVTSLARFGDDGRSQGPNRATQKINFIMNQDSANVVLIQEHHLRGNELQKVISIFRKKYNVYQHPALKHHVGTRGGS